ncbi:hypothetical protein LB505_007465 [Fusarium chuoi]|nr:hypothetical protein LB505_007465 [Fusarium chuoi]
MFDRIKTKAFLVACLVFSGSALPNGNEQRHWVGTWASMPQEVEPANLAPAPFMQQLNSKILLSAKHFTCLLELRRSVFDFPTSLAKQTCPSLRHQLLYQLVERPVSVKSIPRPRSSSSSRARSPCLSQQERLCTPTPLTSS